MGRYQRHMIYFKNRKTKSKNAVTLITYFPYFYLVDLFICYVPPSSIPQPLLNRVYRLNNKGQQKTTLAWIDTQCLRSATALGLTHIEKIQNEEKNVPTTTHTHTCIDKVYSWLLYFMHEQLTSEGIEIGFW